MSFKSTILIVGGGSAGYGMAKSLSEALDARRFSILLITERNFHIHYPAMLRASVTSDGDLENLAFVPYDRLFKPGRSGEVVVGTVQRVEDGVVIMAGGRRFAYDWLVLATGTQWEGPLAFPYDRNDALHWVRDWRAKISLAHRILLVGGGAVGIELAGEIRHYFPHKEVTLVHSDEELLNETYPSKFREALTEAVRIRGTRLILDDRLETFAENQSPVFTKRGAKVDTDLIIPTRGGHPKTAFLRSFDPSILTREGRVKVLPTLQVPLSNGRVNVFAVGDIIDWNEQKGLAKVPGHIEIATANIVNAIKGHPTEKSYTGTVETIAIPFGPNGGTSFVATLWGIILGDWPTKKLKSQKLFIDMPRKELGY